VPDGPSRFAILCVLGYLAASWIVRFDTPDGEHNASLTYPFDTYSMYSRSMPDDVARVVVRTADGGFRHVTDFRAFACDPPPDITRRCGSDAVSIAYVDDDAMRWIHDHTGPGTERVEIVRRAWSFGHGAPAEQAPCVIGICTVDR
jgi:hypothetical protein